MRCSLQTLYDRIIVDRDIVKTIYLLSVAYSNDRLCILVEEYIVQQKSVFTLQGVCSFVLYWAMEDGHTSGVGFYESNQLAQSDCERIRSVLGKIAREGRIMASGEQYQKLTN